MVADVGRGTVGLVLLVSSPRTIQGHTPVQYMINTTFVKSLFSKGHTIAFGIRLRTIVVLPQQHWEVFQLLPLVFFLQNHGAPRWTYSKY